MIKEIANTGHLDSLAVFLTTLAVYFAVRSFGLDGNPRRQRWYALFAAVGLALAIGAKLYPIVLVPWFAAVWLQSLGWRWALSVAALLTVLSAGVMLPMIPVDRVLSVFRGQSAPAMTGGWDGEIPGELAGARPQDPSTGLTAFLRYWQMNDFLPMLLMENLRPVSDAPGEQTAWLTMSGLVMIYYLRFWFAHHWGDQPVLGTGYAGGAFFDFVVTWVEFGPWFVWLTCETAVARLRKTKNSSPIV